MYELPTLSKIFTSISGNLIRRNSDPEDSIECYSDSLGRVILYKLEMKCLHDIADVDQDPCLPLVVLDPEGTSKICGDI